MKKIVVRLESEVDESDEETSAIRCRDLPLASVEIGIDEWVAS